MYKYEVIVWWSDADNAYLAEAPELAGCMADGSTYAAAIENLQIVIGQWIQTAQELGRPIPEPKGRRLAFA